jgi:hypothetical protein
MKDRRRQRKGIINNSSNARDKKIKTMNRELFISTIGAVGLSIAWMIEFFRLGVVSIAHVDIPAPLAQVLLIIVIPLSVVLVWYSLKALKNSNSNA